VWLLLTQTLRDWSDDRTARLGAALAYYTLFSLAPLLIVALTVAGMFFEPEQVRGELNTQLTQLLGQAGAEGVQGMLAAAQQPSTGGMAAIFGTLMLIWGATGAFIQLQDALNTIWEVEPKAGRGWLATLKHRILSFLMVLGTGFLLLVSLIVSTILQAASMWVETTIAGPDWIVGALHSIGSYLVITLLFALIFKYVPDVVIRWRDVWVGAAVTSLLFVIGKGAIGFYLGRGGLTSSFGAAASFAIILVWIYYSSQIVFFGAEFTQAYARMYGKRVIPGRGARSTTKRPRRNQSL
jgi:membrane protein